MSDQALTWTGIYGLFLVGFAIATSGLAAGAIFPSSLELPRWVAWTQGFSTREQLLRSRRGVVFGHGLLGFLLVALPVALVLYAPQGEPVVVEQRTGAIVYLVPVATWTLRVVVYARRSHVRAQASPAAEARDVRRPRGIAAPSELPGGPIVGIALLVYVPIASFVLYAGPRFPLLVEGPVLMLPVAAYLLLAFVRQRH